MSVVNVDMSVVKSTDNVPRKLNVGDLYAVVIVIYSTVIVFRHFPQVFVELIS